MVKFGGEIGTLYQIFTPCTPCKIGQMFKRKGGGVKGLLNNVQKTALFSQEGIPNIWVPKYIQYRQSMQRLNEQ